MTHSPFLLLVMVALAQSSQVSLSSAGEQKMMRSEALVSTTMASVQASDVSINWAEKLNPPPQVIACVGKQKGDQCTHSPAAGQAPCTHPPCQGRCVQSAGNDMRCLTELDPAIIACNGHQEGEGCHIHKGSNNLEGTCGRAWPTWHMWCIYRPPFKLVKKPVVRHAATESSSMTQSYGIPFAMPKEGRPEGCLSRVYDTSKMPTVSLVIPYLHENFTLIQHTVGSLLANTPPELLDQILFVDDANTQAYSYAEAIRALHPKVRVHHNDKRQGLIKAKVTGASLTTSPVIVFFEPHCIANRQWLEPLLEQLAREPQSVAVPIIDIIPEANTDHYDYIDPMYGGFGWNLEFTWPGTAKARNKSWKPTDPFDMPSMSGGLFAITRDWWERSGTYDSMMTEWGGEQIEMSLRMWRCDGSVRALPCSRIGHMFRGSRPYVFHGDAARRNNARVAAVWLDNHIQDAARAVHAHYSDLSVAGNIDERLALKKRLHCKDMDWYLDNVYPELKKALKELPH